MCAFFIFNPVSSIKQAFLCASDQDSEDGHTCVLALSATFFYPEDGHTCVLASSATFFYPKDGKLKGKRKAAGVSGDTMNLKTLCEVQLSRYVFRDAAKNGAGLPAPPKASDGLLIDRQPCAEDARPPIALSVY